MDFALTDEQELILATVRDFTNRELLPHEDDVERLGQVPAEVAERIRKRAIEAGIFAANMPVEVGGAGLDNLTMALVEKELGRVSYALHHLVARPSNILLACVGPQRERYLYLYPTVAGDRMEALAMSEPDAGSDLRGMKCRAVREGDEYVISGVKHFISHADICDYVILFAATGPDPGAGSAGGAHPSGSPPSWWMWGLPASRCGRATNRSRIGGTTTRSSISTTAASRSPRSWERSIAGSR